MQLSTKLHMQQKLKYINHTYIFSSIPLRIFGSAISELFQKTNNIFNEWKSPMDQTKKIDLTTLQVKIPYNLYLRVH